MQNLERLTRLVCRVAHEAGSYIKKERASFSAERVERKHAHDYVSYVDKGSEQFIVQSLRTLLPEAGFITEEGLATHTDEQLLWVVDPLDGTTNFIHGFAPYAVSIALIRGSQILLGVVYEIVAGECFYAWQGGGAHCERRNDRGEVVSNERLHVGTSVTEDALVCLQYPYDSESYSPVIQRLVAQFYGRVASIRSIGSAAIALCYVAAGRLDAYAECYIGQWDYMAGALIVSEAGGRVTDYEGNPRFMQGNSVVATNGTVLHDDLLAGISAAR